MSVSHPQQTDLAALVTARICHDLISPIGAVDNGLELVASLGAAPLPSDLAMIAESARLATLKMRVFRLAFGAPKGAHIDADELRSICETVLARPRQTLDWAFPNGALPRNLAQVLVLLVMCADSAMARGGTLRVGGSSSHITLHCQTERPRIDEDAWSFFDNELPQTLLQAGQVHFAFARMSADRLGLQIDWRATDTTVSLSAAPL